MSGTCTTLADCKYIVVGAGGGHSPLKRRSLGANRYCLEGGEGPRHPSGGNLADPASDRLPDDYDDPCFPALAIEHDVMK